MASLVDFIAHCLFEKNIEVLHCHVISILIIITFPKANGLLLLIGIFSEPRNFNERLSIRKTWLKLISGDNDVQYFFIVGKENCPIPPETRKNPFGCDERKLILEPTVQRSSRQTKVNHNLVTTGFTFVAENEITVTHLLVPACVLLRAQSPIRVKLIDAFDNKILSSVTFKPGNGTQMKAIRPVIFPRQSEGVVVVEIPGEDEMQVCSCSKHTFNANGSLSFGGIIRGGRLVLFDQTFRTCVYMLYNVTELTHDHKSQQLAWTQSSRAVFRSLEEEQKIFKDLMIANVTDYYRNLPRKLLTFVEQAYQLSHFQFLLKTDDDSFIDLPRLLAELKRVNSDKMWWWSYFKEYHYVPLNGKWREERYRSATYPPFPCGGGYVVNHRVVQYLAESSKNLAMFQGEDVSLGIWMAGTSIERHQPMEGNSPSYKAIMQGICEEPCQWVCSEDRRRSNCNRVQLSVNAMYQLWDQYKRDGRLK